MMPDWEPRECECGHREHGGTCHGTRSTFYPMGTHVFPAGARVTKVRPNTTDMLRVDERCPCPSFYEYEGEQP